MGCKFYTDVMRTNVSHIKSKIIVLLIVLLGALSGIITGAFFAFTHDLPQIRSLQDFRPSAVTRIYSADDVLLTELFVEKRDPVSLDTIPEHLKIALLTTEDRNFYRHSGVDLKGILRAIIKDIRARQFVEGASTITQQIAKTLFLSSRKTLTRKIKEALLAFQLERRYTKDEILELYLNQVYFGSGAYGVESAARIFFGKSVNELSLAECALIAGMPKAPSRYSPLNNKERALKRRNIVLKQMLDTGEINRSAYDEALRESISDNRVNLNRIKAPYFVDYVKEFLEDALGSSRLYKGGLTVYTTLSFELQKAAQHAVATGLANLERGIKRRGVFSSDPQCALICLNVQSGGILAVIGGKDHDKSAFNRAINAKRQPGSAFKPIVYALAVERGFPQNSVLLDAPIAFRTKSHDKDWKPENYDKKYRGEMTFRKALSISQNIPTIRLIETLGPSSVAGFAHKLGIESNLAPNLSLALGTSEVTLIELTSAYAVFANKGKWIKPFGVLEVVDHRGRIIWRVKPQKKVVMSHAGAAVITDMLTAVIKEGTGKKAEVLAYSIAGKTGTTSQNRDALFVGYSPSIATGIWVGQDTFKSLGDHLTGATAALPIWIDFMSKALEHKSYEYFDFPDDVVLVRIDSTTGALTSEDNPHSVNAYFKAGTEPRPYP